MKITFIGGGNMATALIGGLIAQGRRAADLHVGEISAPARARLKECFGVDGDETVGEPAAACDCVVLAVKPQKLREAAAALAPRLNRQVVLSIAAGVRIGDISRWLGGYSRIARAMPNTPALINAGISGLYAGPALAAGERETAAGVLSAVGQVVWVERE